GPGMFRVMGLGAVGDGTGRFRVITGLDPAIPTRRPLRLTNRDHRVKPGDDKRRGYPHPRPLSHTGEGSGTALNRYLGKAAWLRDRPAVLSPARRPKRLVSPHARPHDRAEGPVRRE